MSDTLIRRIQPGDWVRFYQAGRLVIGEVRYVHERELACTNYAISTDMGRTYDNNVLEIRRALTPNQPS